MNRKAPALALALLGASLAGGASALDLAPPAAPAPAFDLLAYARLVEPVGTSIDFESYNLGCIDGQDGWSSFGCAGRGCAVYDHKVAASGNVAGFGGKSLRMSNAVTSGCFGDQTFSKSLANEAGEAGATNDGMSGGERQLVFDAQWTFAAASPDFQSGLSVVASPDRGDGARMSWVQMADQLGGFQVNFYDYKSGFAGAGCNGDNFRLSNVASNLDRTKPHTVRILMALLDGPDNDLVVVLVDGVVALHLGTSWEDYFRECEGTPGSRTVDSILFRTGGGAAPGTMGKGFLIDNLKMGSYVPSLPLA